MRRRVHSTLAALLMPLVAAWGVPLGAQGAAPPAAAKPAPAAPAAAASAGTAATASAPADAGFSKEQLEQLVAPIALYPDALLMQILMAATYPLEIVEAERWLGKKPDLKSDALEAALKEEDWDPSVKSLCALPDVLKRMSENLDWTQDLGDAFLGQKDPLLDTVQRMRGKAYDAGNLKTTEQQVITVEKEKIIVIQSPAPEVVYVPTYSPTVVYGGWAYPSYYYPTMYPYYPPGAGLVAFGVGVAVGAAIWGNCSWGWGHNNVNVNVNRYNNFNGNTNINANRNTNINANRSGSGQASWQHDPSHRGGVNYQNQNVAGKYGAQSGTNRVSSQQARGYSGSGATGANRAASGSGGASARAQGAGASGQATARAQSSGAGTRPQSSAASSRPSGSGSGYSGSGYGGSSHSAYSGSKSPSSDRAASSRGSMSRGTSSYGGGGYGGGSRGGGSRGGGRRR